MKKILCFGVLIVLIFLGRAAAQEDPHAGCAAPPAVIPAELLERPLTLRDGVGNSRETVTTSVPEAQNFYNQGLNYLESYVWIEAARSFRQALRLDSNFAMAYLGLSYVYSGLEKPDQAKSFLEKAKSLAAGLSDRERRRIEIREKQFAALEKLDDPALHWAYKKAIDDTIAVYVDDPEFWLLRGNAEEPTAAGRGQRGAPASVAFYNQVLRLVPDHASAHHYLVHTYETMQQIDKALVHGAEYAKLSPSIPHAAHMWGHDLRRVGRIDEAVTQFLKTDSLERAYYKAEKMEPGFDWHHGHNLDLLAGSYQHKGQVKEAERILREASDLTVMDAYSAFRERELPTFLVHRAKYQEALEAALVMSRSEYPQARTAGFAIAGQALLGLKKFEEARKMLDSADSALQEIPQITAGIIPSRGFVQPWVESLRGEFLFRTGDSKKGQSILMDVQRKLRAIPGPDAWTQTLFRLESIARIARDAGDWALAEYTAKQMMEHDPAYGGSRLAIALVLREQGDGAAANRELQAAQKFWRDADPDLPELGLIGTEIARVAQHAK